MVAATAGEHLIGCSGLGRFTLALGEGAPVEVELTLPPDADIAAAHMRPPQHAVPVELDAGEAVDVVLTHVVEGFPFGTPGDVFRLDVEPPVAPDDERLDRAVALAASADVAIVVVGTTDEVESESFDRPSLGLPGRQDELIGRVASANPRTVVVVNSGAPVLMPWVDDVPAVLLTWFGGQEYGNALADVLLGRVEPGGRLPTLWPSSEAGLPSPTPADGTLVYEEGLLIGHRNAALLSASLFPFGHGEGYTSWEYVSFEAPAAAGGAASVVVRNTGSRAGREVVQVYASWRGQCGRAPGALARGLRGRGGGAGGVGDRRGRGAAARSRALGRGGARLGAGAGRGHALRGPLERRPPPQRRAPHRLIGGRAARRARPRRAAAGPRRPAPRRAAPHPGRPDRASRGQCAPRAIRRDFGTHPSPSRLEPRAPPREPPAHASTHPRRRASGG